MNIITNFGATGYSGQYSTTSGNYTIAGTVTTDGESTKHIKSFSGEVTVTATGARVSAFTVYLQDTNASNQDAIMAAIKAVRTALDTDLSA